MYKLSLAFVRYWGVHRVRRNSMFKIKYIVYVFPIALIVTLFILRMSPQPDIPRFDHAISSYPTDGYMSTNPSGLTVEDFQEMADPGVEMPDYSTDPPDIFVDGKFEPASTFDSPILLVQSATSDITSPWVGFQITYKGTDGVERDVVPTKENIELILEDWGEDEYQETVRGKLECLSWDVSEDKEKPHLEIVCPHDDCTVYLDFEKVEVLFLMDNESTDHPKGVFFKNDSMPK